MSNDLGIDRSGNDNSWLVSGASYADQMLDTPTNNFATLNPLQTHSQTLSEGNLKTVTAVVNASNSTIGVTSGKWYAEVNFIAGTHCRIGISVGQAGLGENHGFGAGNTWVKINGRIHYHDSTAIPANSGVSIAADDIIGIAVDVDAGKLWFSKNGTWEDNASGTGVPANGTNPIYNDAGIRSGKPMFFGVASGSGNLTYVFNFGQDSSFAGAETAQGETDGNNIGDFYYEPPTGFLALCTANLPEPDVIPSEHFNTVLYTGNDNDNHAITGVGFQPDFLWIKNRGTTDIHELVDSVRGQFSGGNGLGRLRSNDTTAEIDSTIEGFTADGFTLDGDNTGYNGDGGSYVAWNWKAATAFSNDASATSIGNLDSAGKVNTAAGFSIVSWVADGNGNTTTSAVAHGLSQKAELVIAKRRPGARNWHVGHKDLPFNAGDNSHNGVLTLNQDVANEANNTGLADMPNATTFIARGDDGDNYIAYCFHSVEGYSKVGSYEGNDNADGTFVYTGFSPKFILFKNIERAGQDWGIYDNVRHTTNPLGDRLFANDTPAESANTANIDFLSNGFKWRDDSFVNNYTETYIYIAFAEMPFSYSNAK